MSHASAPYVPRRPQESLYYRLVKEHRRELVEHAREHYAAPLPKHVEDELRGVLSCGDFGEGFVLLACRSCGHALMVAFSCKRRGACPSCAGRRMAGSAAHLVDRILPSRPVRQFVLSFPYELSNLAAVHPAVLRHLCKVFWEALRRRYARWAKGAGYVAAETGAVTGVQRFGSSLNLHVHFHVLVVDGVHFFEDDELRFADAPAPTTDELEALVKYVHGRVMKWLAKRGYLRDPKAAHDSNEEPQLSLAEALVLTGSQRGTFATTKDRAANDDDEHSAHAGSKSPTSSGAVTFERFNLHAGVHLAADDDRGRERLCRYLTRPAFALDRLGQRADGMVTYRVKKVGRGREKVRVMTPLDFMARLASLIPPPRYPLLRFHGVLAPRHVWRDRVVPKPPPAKTKKKACDDATANTNDSGKTTTRPAAAPPKPERHPGDGREVFSFPEPVHAVPLREFLDSGVAENVAPNILSVAHWERLNRGELYAPLARVEWATLLKRTFGTDVKKCGRCGATVAVKAVVTEPDAIEKMLRTLRAPGATGSARAPPANANAHP